MVFNKFFTMPERQSSCTSDSQVHSKKFSMLEDNLWHSLTHVPQNCALCKDSTWSPSEILVIAVPWNDMLSSFTLVKCLLGMVTSPATKCQRNVIKAGKNG